MSFWNWLKSLFGIKEKPNLTIVPPPAPIPERPPLSARPPIESNPTARVRGLDVAKYQDKMDATEWKEAWDKGFRFVYAKCTDGATGKDAFYQLHRRLAKQQGFLFG